MMVIPGKSKRLANLELSATAATIQYVKSTLQDKADQFYLVEAQIGTPPQATRMIIDTGSSDMWVKDGYDSSASTSALKPDSKKVSLQYGKGFMSGNQIEDQVCLGKMCLPNQDFILANTVKDIGNN